MSPILKRIVQLLVLVLLQAALLFLGAGTPRWAAAWWYIGLYVVMLAGASIVMLPGNREVIEERSKGTQGAKPWDLLITRLIAIPTLGLLLLAGLDERFHWTSPLPWWLRLVGALLFALGYALVLWAMTTNKFFSQVVRIQSERGHAVITGGPYRLVRHPGYLGMIGSMLGSVFLLDSLYGLACFGPYLALVLARTSLEDRTLRAELPGYADYTARTKFRLLPGVW